MAQQTALSVLGTPGQTQSFVAKTVAPEPEIIAVAVGTGKWKKKGKPRLPDPISFRKRQQEWKAHVAEAEVRMSQIHTDAGKARREAIESERPKESVESQRARTRQHKKPGLEIQRPEGLSDRKAPPPPQPPRPVSPKPPPPVEPSEDPVAARVREIKRQSVEKRVEKSMLADEKRIRTEEIEARERRKRALINLEFAKEAQAKKQAVEDARNKQRGKALQKARAAKKRKAKRNK